MKEFINNNGEKKANIINGVIESDSEIFSNKVIQHFDKFKNTYYSIEKNDDTNYVVKRDDSSEILITKNGTYDYNPYEYKYDINFHTTKLKDIELPDLSDYTIQNEGKTEESTKENITDNKEKFLREFPDGIAKWKFVDGPTCSETEIGVYSIEEYKGLESNMVIYIHDTSVTENMNYIAYTRAKYYLIELVRSF